MGGFTATFGKAIPMQLGIPPSVGRGVPAEPYLIEMRCVGRRVHEIPNGRILGRPGRGRSAPTRG